MIHRCLPNLSSRFIGTNRDEGSANKEIAARLDISVRTIEVYKMRAMEKMGMKNRIDIVRYALLQGWLQDN